MSIPAFSDVAKAANDVCTSLPPPPGPIELQSSRIPLQLLTKDFYHTSASAFEVKDTTPNNVAFKVTGKSTHEGATSGLVCHQWSAEHFWRTG